MRRFDCSRCDSDTAVPDDQPGTPMHTCPGLSGMTVPYAPAGRRSDAQLVAREDYVGAEDVQRDAEGRVWMAALVTTDDCEHVAVYAPTATARIG